LQRSFLSPRDRKDLEKREQRDFMRGTIQDKLASAERVAESQAQAQAQGADQPMRDRYRTVPLKNKDGSQSFVTIDSVTGQQVDAPTSEAGALEESLKRPGFMGWASRFMGNKYIGKDADAVAAIQAAREREAGRYEGGAAPQQTFDEAVRGYESRVGRKMTAEELAQARKRFGI
jgi:hypothetical protein